MEFIHFRYEVDLVNNIIMIIGIILLVAGIIGLTVKNFNIVPAFITNNLRYIIIIGIIAVCFSFLGFLGLIAGGIISLLIVFGGVL